MIELLLEAERALSMGRADRAELLYRQVADGDPRNSIAVVGLARVALERADDAGALVLARRALSIDGDNVAAQRLVQRLEEVLTTRGEALPAAEVPPPAEVPARARSTPFDGPDPVLAGSPTTPSTPASPAPVARPTPAEPPRSRSLLDRLRGR